MNPGYELRITEGKGEGVVACRDFQRGQLVMKGKIEKELETSTSHSSQIGRNRHVLHAGLISTVNHSCNPNCGIRVNETGAHDFLAFRDIRAGEELTFDYAMRNYSVDHFPLRCMCGAPQCRGEITGWKSLPEEVRKAYEGFVSPYLLEMTRESRQTDKSEIYPLPMENRGVESSNSELEAAAPGSVQSETEAVIG